MRVPFLDLSRAHGSIRAAALADIAELLDSNAYTNGPAVCAFESAFARYCGTAECVGVASGLDALRLGLIAAGLEPGQAVAVPAATFAATFEAVTQAGGVPFVIDIRDDDFGLDCEELAARLSDRVRFVMPVHLYGQMTNMVELLDLAEKSSLEVVNDACQAHGARRDGLSAADGARASGFSFYPGKNLGAFGDAGAVVTDDPHLAARLRALREHGQTSKYHHAYEGWTSRLDTIQAIVLLRKLQHLDDWNEQRRRAAALYIEALAGVGDVQLPAVARASTHVWHLFVIRTADPDGLAEFLRDREIGTGRHYPVPPHRSPAYQHLNLPAGSFPRAERLSRECLSLPMYPGITDAEVETVTAAISAFFDGR